MAKYQGRLELISDSIGKPFRREVIENAILEIETTEPTTLVGPDGHVIMSLHPTRIAWLGGEASKMRTATSIAFVSDAGESIFEDSDLNLNWPPRQIDRGVEFQI